MNGTPAAAAYQIVPRKEAYAIEQASRLAWTNMEDSAELVRARAGYHGLGRDSGPRQHQT